MKKLSSSKILSLVLAFCGATAIASQAQTFTNILSFDGANGGNPFYMSLTQGTNGDLYGTTYNGGASGYGTVFGITPEGVLTTLFSFDNTNGAFPSGGLVLGTSGDLYGTTYEGGTNSSGTVFKITPGGKLTTLYNFCSQTNCNDGFGPYSPLAGGSNGNLYGTTDRGGPDNDGVVYSINPNAADADSAATFTVLFSFNSTDGEWPYGGLVQATNGNFYGTTTYGGANGEGTIFEITSAGKLTTLVNLDSTTGAYPYAGLMQGANGNFYGTTANGGTSNDGTVFEVTSAGKVTVLHNFDGTDGASPLAPLVQAPNGNFYGTTSVGGNSTCTNGCGTLFEITPAGKLTTLHSFDSTDGQWPYGGLFQATSGVFYGTTTYGGSDDTNCGNTGCGTLFSLSDGLGAFVRTVPTTGKVGTKVTILGTDLTGSSAVTFNGVTATFTVVSATEITTTVPTGATTGSVEVTTPSGTLASNVKFQVP